MVVLDIAIVNVALPSIQQDLGIEQSTLQWIVIAYGLMLGGFLLLGGRMADLPGALTAAIAFPRPHIAEDPARAGSVPRFDRPGADRRVCLKCDLSRGLSRRWR
jgi:MFS family permease